MVWKSSVAADAALLFLPKLGTAGFDAAIVLRRFTAACSNFLYTSFI